MTVVCAMGLLRQFSIQDGKVDMAFVVSDSLSGQWEGKGRPTIHMLRHLAARG